MTDQQKIKELEKEIERLKKEISMINEPCCQSCREDEEYGYSTENCCCRHSHNYKADKFAEEEIESLKKQLVQKDARIEELLSENKRLSEDNCNLYVHSMGKVLEGKEPAIIKTFNKQSSLLHELGNALKQINFDNNHDCRIYRKEGSCEHLQEWQTEINLKEALTKYQSFKDSQP